MFGGIIWLLTTINIRSEPNRTCKQDVRVYAYVYAHENNIPETDAEIILYVSLFHCVCVTIRIKQLSTRNMNTRTRERGRERERSQ